MRTVPAILAAVAVLIATACGSTPKPRAPSPPVKGSIEVSSAFMAGAAIPSAYTCDGRDVSPPLHAVGLPAATKELVVVMRDPDAPGGDFIHWQIARIEPARVASQPEHSVFLPVAGKPRDAVVGLNSFGSLGYRGPCPPRGAAAHHYEITVYALGQASGLKQGFSADAVAALPVLGQGTLTGAYARR
jgi:Raf kinase inhibitor-like YbhB/YbcL family protein